MKIRIPMLHERDVFDLIEDPTEALWNLCRNRAKKKAFDKDAEYRRIEILRKTDLGSPFNVFLDKDRGLGLKEWTYQLDTQKRVYPPLRFATWLMQQAKKPRHGWSEVRAAWLRARRGYDYSAVWDFHSWHTNYVIKILTDYSKNLHGHPASMTPQEWETILKGIIDAFKAVQEADRDGTDSEEMQRRVDFAFRALATYYQHLWD